jgi:hypothetical protein
MNGVGAGVLRRANEPVHIQIRFGGRSLAYMNRLVGHEDMMRKPVGRAVDSDGAYLPVAACVHYAHGRHAPIGNQQTSDLFIHLR